MRETSMPFSLTTPLNHGHASTGRRAKPQPPELPARIEIPKTQRQALLLLNAEEREAALDELIGKLREELEWRLAIESAR